MLELHKSMSWLRFNFIPREGEMHSILIRVSLIWVSAGESCFLMLPKGSHAELRALRVLVTLGGACAKTTGGGFHSVGDGGGMWYSVLLQSDGHELSHSSGSGLGLLNSAIASLSWQSRSHSKKGVSVSSSNQLIFLSRCFISL